MREISLPVYSRRLYYPDPALRGCIESYCVLTPSVFGLPSVPWHIMPDGAAYILLHVHDTQGSTAFPTRLAFVGPRSTYIFANRRKRVLSLIARLKPGARFLPLSVPLSEWRDQGISLENVLSMNLSRAIEELTLLARSNQITALVHRFDQLMLTIRDKRAQQNALVQAAVASVEKSRGQLSMRLLSSALGVSDRHLRAVFNKEIGMSPKKFTRIVRLTETIKAVDCGFAHGWAQLALSSGYYDQSHMIDEFQALVGESTDAFISRTNREEVLMPASDFSNT